MHRAALVLACLAVASVASSEGGELGLEAALGRGPGQCGPGAWVQPSSEWLITRRVIVHLALVQGGPGYWSRGFNQGGEQVHRGRVS